MTPWNIDPHHTALEFAVHHNGITAVRGRFLLLSGTVDTDETGTFHGVRVSIDANSLSTNFEVRDQHLKSPEFFDTAQFPTLEFESRQVTAQGGNRFSVVGDLSMHGVTGPVTLDVQTSTAVVDLIGLTRIGASGSGRLSRQAWGITWNRLLESGGVVLADEISIILNVEALRPALA
ncbi:YceI family protein [Deinococcus radiomollis]|uniref:YceI family protein n=1 Tax=Deinococcus radiomollis TaxID=468916 RepID=UPI003891BAA6